MDLESVTALFRLPTTGGDPSRGAVSGSSLLEAIGDAVVAIDANGAVFYWGAGAAALYGVGAGDALGRPLAELYTYRWSAPEDERRAWLALERDGRWRGRNVHVLPSGAERHVESAVTLLRDAAGRRIGLVAVIRDETERVEAERARRDAEEALRLSEERFRAAFANAAIAFSMAQPDGTFVAVNPAYCALTGYAPDELRKIKVTQIIHPEDRAENMARVRALLAGEIGDFVIENRYRRKAGEAVWVRKSVSLVREGPRPRWVVAIVEDISERRRMERHLRESERQARERAAELQAVLDTVPAAVWIARDARGDHIDANRFGAELLRNAPGTNVSVTAPGADRPRNFTVRRHGEAVGADDLPIQRAARRGEEVRGAEIDLVFDDGEVRHLLGNAAPLRGGEGETKGSVGAFIDITDRKRAEEALREADRRKTEFLALLSHELRNPLAPIRTGLLVLEQAPPGSETARRAREVLRRQTDQLSRLVDDLLDLSRITHGKVDVQLARLDAREIARAAYADARGLFEEREVALALSEPSEPLWVDADAARLGQMLGNLLHNALKFTPARGGVRVEAAARGGACELCVRDSGLGLDRSELGRIFEPFVQGARATQGQRGLGLGLALVRELAAKHGGSVRAESDGPGKGSAFVIALPLAPAPAGAAAGAHAPAVRAPPLTVLVVDDNEDAGNTLAELLALDGHTITLARTGAEGIAAVADLRPQVLLCDIGLPDMSGHEVIRAVRSTAAGRGLLAVALTGYAQPEDRHAALAAGFDAHFPKPAPLEELLAVLASVRGGS